MLTDGKIKGLEVWIERANGTRFNEHAIKTTPATGTEPLTTECWLESEDDQVFRIRLAKLKECPNDLTQSGWKCERLVDGRYLSGSVIHPGELADAKGIIWTRSAVQTAQGVQLYELQFKSHDLASEAADVTMSAEDVAQLGIIEVCLYRGSWTEKQRCLPVAWEKVDNGPILEGKLKLGSKVTGINPILASEVMTYHPLKHHGDKTHVHKFIFKYRNRAVLEIMDIIESAQPPRQPAHVQAEARPRHTGRIKRSRSPSTSPIDLTSDDNAQAAADAQARMKQQAKRIRYLEGMNAKLNAPVKKEKEDEPPADELVDITGDDA